VHIIIRIVELPGFADAGSAGAGIDEPYVQGSSKDPVERAPGTPDLVLERSPFIARLPVGRRTFVPAAAEAVHAAIFLDGDLRTLCLDRLRRAECRE
jgi:hypothetical protein